MNCKIIITVLFILASMCAYAQTDNNRKPQLGVTSVADISGKNIIRKKPELLEADTTTKKSSSVPVSSSKERKPVLAPSGVSEPKDKYPK